MADFRICPACGTRNRLKWEFCVKCGESLQEVATGAQAAAAAAAAVPDVGAFDWKGALITVAALGAAIVVGLRFRPEPAAVDPAIFASPTRADAVQPPSPPEPAPESRVTQGLRRLYAGDAEGALSALAVAAEQDPDDPHARQAYGRALWQAGQRPAAIQQMLAAVRLLPQDPRLQADTARMLVQEGRRAEAIPLFEGALRIEPASPAWLGQLAQIYLDQGNPAQAAVLLERAAEASRGNAAFLQDLGYAYQRAGNPEAAQDAYRRALQSDPRSDTTRALLAEQMLVSGKGEEAIALVREGLERGGPALYRALGSLLERNGRVQEAAEAYREYAKRNPQAADARGLEERAQTLERAPSS
jgi:Flp pilus assembly protein TadD